MEDSRPPSPVFTEGFVRISSQPLGFSSNYYTATFSLPSPLLQSSQQGSRSIFLSPPSLSLLHHVPAQGAVEGVWTKPELGRLPASSRQALGPSRRSAWERLQASSQLLPRPPVYSRLSPELPSSPSSTQASSQLLLRPPVFSRLCLPSSQQALELPASPERAPNSTPGPGFIPSASPIPASVSIVPSPRMEPQISPSSPSMPDNSHYGSGFKLRRLGLRLASRLPASFAPDPSELPVFSLGSSSSSIRTGRLPV